MAKKLVYEINYSCTSCDMCLAICPTGSIFIGRERYVIDTDTCDAHGICMRVCPVSAIIPREIDVNEEKQATPAPKNPAPSSGST